MGSTLLLVHDDIAVIATLRRLLTRAGHEVVLATSVADSLIAFGAHQPALVILSPNVEGGRGRAVLEELANHPGGPQARVMLLGQSIDGFFAPVVPLPLDGATFLELVARSLAGHDEGWSVLEQRQAPVAAEPPPPEEAWRATVPANEPQPLENALFGDMPVLQDSDWSVAVSEDATQLVPRPVLAPETNAMVQEAMAEAERDLEAHTMLAIQPPALDEPTDSDATSLVINAGPAREEPAPQEEPDVTSPAIAVPVEPDATSREIVVPPPEVAPASDHEARLAFESARALKALELVDAMKGELEQATGRAEAARHDRDVALGERAELLARLEVAQAAIARNAEDAKSVEVERERADGLARELAAAQARVHELDQQRTKLAESLTQVEKEKEGFAAELEWVRSTETASADQLTSRALKAETDLTHWRELAEQHGTEKERLAAELERLRGESAAAVEERSAAQESFDAERAQVAKFLAEKDGRIAELEKSLAREKTSTVEQRKAITEAQSRNGLLEELLKNQQRALADEHQARSGKEAQGAQLATRVAELEARLAATETERASLSAQLAGAQEKISELETTAGAERLAKEEAQAKIAELVQTIASAESERTELSTQLSAWQSRAAELEESVREHSGASTEAQAKIAELEQTSEEHRMAAAEARERITGLEAAHTTATEQLREASERQGRIDAELAEAKNRIEELELQIETRKTKVEKLERTLEKTKAEQGARIEKADARIAELETQRTELEAQIATLEKSIAELEQRASEREQTIVSAESQQKALESQMTTLEKSIAERDQTIESAESQRKVLDAQIVTLQKAIAELELHSSERERTLSALEAKREQLAAELATSQKKASAAEAEVTERASRNAELEQTIAKNLEDAEAALAAEKKRAADALGAAETERTRIAAELMQAQGRLTETRASLEQLQTEHAEAVDGLKKKVRDLELARAESQARVLKLDGALAARKQEAQAESLLARRKIDELEAALASLQQAAAETRNQLEAESAAKAQTEAALETAKQESAKLKSELDEAVVPLMGPNREPWSVPTTGGVTPTQLAKLIRRLGAADADVRLELKAGNALRVLWIRAGRLVAASSNREEESLLDRAQRDGLVDARQVRELKVLRAENDAALLAAMRGRGLLRDAEVVPLCQRQLERLAVDAVSEPESVYRIAKGGPPPDALPVAHVRPLEMLIAEALRRTMGAIEVSVELLRSVASLRADANALAQVGFGDREQALLLAADGKATVQALVLSSGLRSNAAIRALSVAQALELVELRPPPEGEAAEPPPDLEVERLAAKFETSSEADYFTVLGVPRGAGNDEVARAYKTLRDEFHPLRFAGHPDARLQRNAEALQALFAEAAQALADERLRAEYARNLVE
jgi:chromosome segregation ATPase